MKPIITQNLIRSFGRVNGRKLRVGQSGLIDNLLPKFAIKVKGEELKEQGSGVRDKGRKDFEIEGLDLENIFSKSQSPTSDPRPLSPELWLEIGFGYGEHLVGLAMKYPEINFIGCEPFVNGVATLLKHIDDNKVENIRILHGDARLLTQKLPDSSIDRLFILFPDPWPKSKHHKKRIISAENLKDFARIIKPGGRLEIATDHVAYGEWIAEHLAASQEFTVNKKLGIDAIPEDWVETRYQLKARAQGRGARFFNYVKML